MVASPVSTTEYTSFDILGRVTGHKQTTDGNEYTTGYTYKLSGALDEQTYPSGRVVKNELDVSGDLAFVISKENSSAIYKTYANDFTYNAAGAISSLKLGNGRFESTQFNNRLQPTQIALGSSVGNAGLLKIDYTYNTTGNADNNGNVLSQTITVPGLSHPFVQTYTYDELNRLKSATETNNSTQTWKQTFTFDRYGNRRFDEANTTMPTSFSNQALTNPTISTSNNRLTSTGWAYDSAGNTTGDPDGRSFIYDAENKQIEVKNSSNASIGTYFFDGDGKRVKKVVPSTGETTIFVYDAAGKQIAEYSTVVASANDAKVAYLTADHLGSPRINTDVNGQVTARHDYHPFGEEIATAQRTTALGYADDTVRKQFTGYERDTETDLDFAQARMYASSFGRFMSPDSFTNATKVSDPPSWNLYLCVTNKPMNLVDPSGKKGEISWYTDNDGVIQVNVKASFAVYGAAGQNVSKADLKIYKDALVKGIRELLTRSGEIDGKSVQLTTNISAKIYSSEESAIHSGRDNVVAIGYDAIQDDDGRKAVGITFGIAGEKFDRMAVSVAHDPNGGGLAPAGGWVEVAKNIFGHEFGSHGLGGTHNDNPGEEASLFSPDGGNGAIFQSDLKQIVFGYNDQTFIDAPPARGQKYVPVAPSYNLSATGNSSRRANAIYRNSTNPADVYHWVSSVKH